jgi:septum formation protein
MAPNTDPIILASQSPRRKYLLEQAGLQFEVRPSAFDESSVAIEQPNEYARKLAEAKALDIAQNVPNAWVIGADTIVLINNTILGKPNSVDEARSMLIRLSGQTHVVLTGYAIVHLANKKMHTDTVTTEVVFKSLSDQEIEWYINTQEPFDKAGAYAIQGLGTFLVRKINGSYTNVVGLPVCEVIEYLITNDVIGRKA